MVYKEGKIHEDSYLELSLELKRHDVLFKSKLLHSGLLRTSTSSPSRMVLGYLIWCQFGESWFGENYTENSSFDIESNSVQLG